jgi:energy-coupling factor transporter ATP-binding protein EcfA2
MSEIVRVEGLNFRYKRGTIPALKNINFSINAGEFVGITGPAGAGKTTLLSCINGIIPHYYSGDLQGKVTVNELDVAKSTFRELAGHIGTVFEDPDFQMVSISVEEEVAFGPENLSIPSQEIENRIQTALEKTRISHLRDRAISTLSGGQKQRVAISAVLSMLPKVLLLDDPTSELDPIGTHEVFSALVELNRQAGITIIVVSQDIERLVENADRIFLLSGGELVLGGSPREICLRRDVLESTGVRIPQVVEFTISLFSRLGRPLDRDKLPLTIVEATSLLRDLYQEAGVI